MYFCINSYLPIYQQSYKEIKTNYANLLLGINDFYHIIPFTIL